MTNDDSAAPRDSEAKPKDESPEDVKKAAPAKGDSTDRVAEDRGVEPSNWVLRVVLVLVALVGLYLAFRMSAAFFPRWWAQQVSDQVQGGFTAGTLWGLFYGFMFSVIPLLLLFQIRRRFFSWTWRIIVAAIALLLAAPNWLTLSVVLGTSKAAHAGERIMDVGAPNFRVASLIGVIAGAAVALVLTATSMRMKQRKNQVKRLREERDELRRGVSERPDDSPPR